MKTSIHSGMLIIAASLLLSDCKQKEQPKEEPPKKPKQDYTFSGSVVTPKGEPVDGAEVSVNGKKYATAKEGKFSFVADSAGRYILSIHKRGYAFVSHVFDGPRKGHTYTIRPAFVTTIDPRKKNVIRDLLSTTNCTGSGLQNLQFDADYKKIPFIFNGKGKLVDFGWPAGIRDIYQFAAGTPACNPGATLTIPARSIVNASQQTVTTPVTVSIATLDVQSPDGMPGDFGYTDGGGSGLMVSAGAVIIETYSNEESYNVDPKASVKLELPVEPAMLKFNKKIPDQVPMFYYDEKNGIWVEEVKKYGKFNKKTRSYEVDLKHFSAINFDFKIPNTTCIRFRQSNPAVTTFDLTVLSKQYGYGFSRAPHGDETAATCFNISGNNLHFAYNIPASDSICFLLKPTGSSTLAYGIAILATNPDIYTYNPASPPVANCGACSDAAYASCYDGALGICQENTCPVFTTVNCNYLSLTNYTDEVILAAGFSDNTTGPANLKLAWIFKNPTGGGTYDVNVDLLNSGGTSIATIPFTGIATGTEITKRAIPWDAVTYGSAVSARITVNGLATAPASRVSNAAPL